MRKIDQDWKQFLLYTYYIFYYREPNPENLPAFEATVAVHADEESGLDRTSHIILYQEGGKKEPLMKYKMSHVKTLPVAWLLQSIFQHKLLQPELFVP